MSARTQKTERLVIGSGIAASALAALLAERGQRVTLVVEEEAPQPPLVDFPLWQRTPQRLTLALAAWQALQRPPAGDLLADLDASIQPIEAHLAATPEERPAIAEAIAATNAGRLAQGELLLSGVRINSTALIAQLRARLTAAGGTHIVTRVRGISVIEGEVLGVIAEAGRWDAPLVLNASDGDRALALARMARDPVALMQTVTPLAHCPGSEAPTTATWDGSAAWAQAGNGCFVLGTLPGGSQAADCQAVASLSRSDATHEVIFGPGVTRGYWRLLGTTGWPLLALGAARALAEQLLQPA